MRIKNYGTVKVSIVCDDRILIKLFNVIIRLSVNVHIAIEILSKDGLLQIWGMVEVYSYTFAVGYATAGLHATEVDSIDRYAAAARAACPYTCTAAVQIAVAAI